MTARERQVVLLGASTIAVAVVVLRVLPWLVRTHAALRDRAAQQVELATSAHRTIESLPALRDTVAYALADFVALAPQLVSRGSPAEAAAALSGEVSRRAHQARLQVIQLNPVNDSTAGVLGRVTVHAELEGDLAGLAAFLADVETGDPILSVTSIAIRSREGRPDGPTPQVLRTELDVCGWYLTEERT